MNITEFTFQSKQLGFAIFETLLTSSNGITFGVIYRSNQPASNAVIFEAFQKDKNAFFIDVSTSAVTSKKSSKKKLKSSQKLLTNG